MKYVLVVLPDSVAFGPYDTPELAEEEARKYYGKGFEHADTNGDFLVMMLLDRVADPLPRKE